MLHAGGVFLMLFVASANLLPTGSPFGIPIREPLFWGVLAICLWLLAFSRQRVDGMGLLAFAVFVVLFIIVYTIRGLALGNFPPAYVLADARSIAITLIMPLLTWILVAYRGASPASVMSGFIGGALIYAALKSLFFLFLIAVPELVQPLVYFFSDNEDFNFKFGFVMPGVSRIQSGLDFALLVSLCFIVFDSDLTPGLRIRARSLVILIFTLALLSTFSRLLLALLLLVGFVWFFRSFSLRRALGSGVAAAVALVILGPAIAEAFQARVSSGSVGDRARISQLEALVDLWDRQIWFGHGFGAFAPHEIRDSIAPYNYELQLHSLAGKIGISGIIWVVIMLVSALVLAGRPMPNHARAAMLTGFAALLMAGATNPYLFSAAASSVYISLLIGLRLAIVVDRLPK